MRKLMMVCAISLLISGGMVAFDCMQNKDKDDAKIYYIEEMEKTDNGEYKYVTTDGKIHFAMRDVTVVYEEIDVSYLEVRRGQKVFHMKK